MSEVVVVEEARPWGKVGGVSTLSGRPSLSCTPWSDLPGVLSALPQGFLST